MMMEWRVLLLAFLSPSFALRDGDQQNVHSQPLEKCDRSMINDPRYPHTGFMRGGDNSLNDRCTATAIDSGSHYVCVNLPEAKIDGELYSPFWTKTGQAFDEKEATSWPKPGPWCICMWAFANMLGMHPEFADDLNCNATNHWVLENYNVQHPGELRALKAVCGKCGVKSDKCTEAMALP
eukprot:CAMPEP_0197532870 /NCGR_PEP_ID=MMETSP1318-20131121/41250_1 /TAXON_ID=552666 /ORGANISM="Partenskyella glossopodia, Strain RCC365" /LENGTH=179 /DNA_ID=CAMNT_0043089555 /DNA_START=12 /DNA_END=551 /DNA_ORIENTATION=-